MAVITVFFTACSYLGAGLLAWRLTPRPFATFRAASPAQAAVTPFVSIIVPARDEEAVLPRLLASLCAIQYPQFEVIVVDDCSRDATAKIAASFGAKVVSGAPLPAGWRGKQWACWQGVEAARGQLFLFTDADTVHAPRSLAQAVPALLARGAALLTSPPHHDCQTNWEKMLGAFHLILVALTNPYGTPRPGRVFAIGQYLLADRAAYENFGGHAAPTVKAAPVEDLPLAHACLAAGGTHLVFHPWDEPLYSVRMYATWPDFVAGWRRNFRAGLSLGNKLMPVEVMLYAAAITGAGRFGAGAPLAIPPMVAAWLLIARRQKRFGSFARWSWWCAPLGLAVFCLETILAVSDSLLGRRLVWKGRAYSQN